MKSMKKLVWAEGIFLGQQHLQTWDRQLERHQHLRQRLSSPFNWGIISMAIDHEALLLGRCQLSQLTALFQDGRYIEHRTSDDEKLTCELSSPGGEALGIYLAIPANEHVAGISGYPSEGRSAAGLPIMMKLRIIMMATASKKCFWPGQTSY